MFRSAKEHSEVDNVKFFNALIFIVVFYKTEKTTLAALLTSWARTNNVYKQCKQQQQSAADSETEHIARQSGKITWLSVNGWQSRLLYAILNSSPSSSRSFSWRITPCITIISNVYFYIPTVFWFTMIACNLYIKNRTGSVSECRTAGTPTDWTDNHVTLPRDG